MPYALQKELMHCADLLNTLGVGLERSKVESRTQSDYGYPS